MEYENYLSRADGGRHPKQGGKQEQKMKSVQSWEDFTLTEQRECDVAMLCPEAASGGRLGAQVFMGTTWAPVQATLLVSCVTLSPLINLSGLLISSLEK